ncbi:hypothetical protein RUE5091_03080 [Ruegeria denitrificans]|uniref:Uncharacterized protein n=1 Tax=Ruegeria denitrificans TaxID=1715692 RepID=A0A0P1IEE2_9RHOB|nr:hypothetical protein [Ruegeria denitrificans]CUK08445.1 hypothetical protein RUE5091_03080 [Ruegeria denitrificans]
MGDPLDEIMARYEAATACGCCCDDDFCAYVEKKKPMTSGARSESLPHSAANQRGSIRYLNENRAG